MDFTTNYKSKACILINQLQNFCQFLVSPESNNFKRKKTYSHSSYFKRKKNNSFICKLCSEFNQFQVAVNLFNINQFFYEQNLYRYVFQFQFKILIFITSSCCYLKVTVLKERELVRFFVQIINIFIMNQFFHYTF